MPTNRRPKSVISKKSHRSNESTSINFSESRTIPKISNGLPPLQFSDINTNNRRELSSLSLIKIPPRTNWSVQDSKLSQINPMHPPLNPYCSTFIDDASPSTVASRISECLRKRSILAEYDDEGATASVLTAERVTFVIALYRGGNGKSSDFSHVVVVECQRIKGCAIEFHRHCRAVMASAKGDSDGLDDRRGNLGAFMTSPLGHGPSFGKITAKGHEVSITPKFIEGNTESISVSIRFAFNGLKKVLDSLNKDRIDVQRLGAESLVLLTDKCSSRLETAYLASLCVLGLPITIFSKKENDFSLNRIHEWIHSIVMNRSTIWWNSDSKTRTLDDSHQNQNVPDISDTDAESEHKTAMCSLAMRALVNSLCLMVCYRHNFPPIHKRYYSHLVEIEFLRGIESSLEGTDRPPSVSLFTAHESAIAARCLHLLSLYSSKVRKFLANHELGTTLTKLEKARLAGLSRHKVLETESKSAQSVLMSSSTI